MLSILLKGGGKATNHGQRPRYIIVITLPRRTLDRSTGTDYCYWMEQAQVPLRQEKVLD